MTGHGQLDIEIDQSEADSGVVVVKLTGELDPATSPQLLREVNATLFTSAPRELVLDFAGVTFMDSAGVRVLIDLHRTQRDRQGILVLQAIPETPRRVLEVTGLTGELDFR